MSNSLATTVQTVFPDVEITRMSEGAVRVVTPGGTFLVRRQTLGENLFTLIDWTGGVVLLESGEEPITILDCLNRIFADTRDELMRTAV